MSPDPHPTTPTPEARRRTRPELHGKEFDPQQYRAGRFIHFNHEGRWVQAELLANGNLEGGKFVARVQLPPTVGRAIDRVELDYIPDVIAFDDVHQGNAHQIADHGVDYQITALSDTGDKKIEYTVVNPAGQEFIVSQELLVAWERTLALETQLQTLTQEIDAVTHQRKKELVAGRKKILDLVTESFSKLPQERADLARKSRRQVEELRTYFEQQHRKAEAEIARVRRTLTEIQGERPERGVRDFAYYNEFKHTQAEEEPQKRTQEVGHTRLKEFAKYIEDIISSNSIALDGLTREEEQRLLYGQDAQGNILDAANPSPTSKFAEARALHQSKVDAYNAAQAAAGGGNNRGGGGGNNRGGGLPNPGLFNPASVILNPEEKQKARENARLVFLQELSEQIENAVNPPAPAGGGPAPASRANQELRDVHAEIQRRMATFGAARLGLGRPGGHDGALAINKLLEDSKKDFEYRPQRIAPDAHIFDFEGELDKSKVKINELLERINEDGELKDGFEPIRDRLLQLQREESTTRNTHSTLTEFQRAIGDSTLTVDDLNQSRVHDAQLFHSELQTIENDIARQEMVSHDTQAERDRQMSQESKEERNKETEVVNIPFEQLAHLIPGDRPQRILHQFLDSAFDSADNPQVLAGRVMAEFARLFDNVNLTADQRRQLRACGIKDMNEFRRVWKERYSKDVAAAYTKWEEDHIRQYVAERMQSNLGAMTEKEARKWKQTLLRVGTGLLLIGTAVGVTLGTFGVATLGVVGAFGAGAAMAGANVAVQRKVYNAREGIFAKIGNWFRRGEQRADERTRQNVRQNFVRDLERNFDDDPDSDDMRRFAKLISSALRTSSLQHVAEVRGQAIADVDRDQQYFEILRGMESQNPDERQVYELIEARRRMSLGSGMVERRIDDAEKQKITDRAEREQMMAEWKGKGGVVRTMMYGGGMAVAMDQLAGATAGMSVPFGGREIALATIGGIVGGIKGYKFAQTREQQAERNHAREELDQLIRHVDNAVTAHMAPTDARYQQALQHFRHLTQWVNGLALNEGDYGAATQYERGAFVSVGEEYKRGEKQVVPFTNTAFLEEAKMTIRRANELGMTAETPEQRYELASALEAAKSFGRADGRTAEEERLRDRQETSVPMKIGRRAFWTLAGSLFGAGKMVAYGYVLPAVRNAATEGVVWTAQHIGHGAAVAGEWVYDHAFGVGHAEASTATPHPGNLEQLSHAWDDFKHGMGELGNTAQHAGQSLAAGGAALYHAGEQAFEHAVHDTSTHDTGDTDHLEDTTTATHDAAPTTEHEFASHTTIVKGEGVLHGLADFRHPHLDVNSSELDGEARAALDKFEQMSPKEFKEWQFEQLHDMGFRYIDGKLGYPFTVHPGAQMEFYYDHTDHEWHAQFDQDAGHIDMHQTYHFHATHEGTAGHDELKPELKAQLEQGRNNVKSFVQWVNHNDHQTVPEGVIVDRFLHGRLEVGPDRLGDMVSVQSVHDGNLVQITLMDDRTTLAFPVLEGDTWHLKPVFDAPVWDVVHGQMDDMMTHVPGTVGTSGYEASKIPVDTEHAHVFAPEKTIPSSTSTGTGIDAQHAHITTGSGGGGSQRYEPGVETTAGGTPAGGESGQTDTGAPVQGSAEATTPMPEAAIVGQYDGFKQSFEQMVEKDFTDITPVDSRAEDVLRTLHQQMDSTLGKLSMGKELHDLIVRGQGDSPAARQLFLHSVDQALPPELRVLFSEAGASGQSFFTTDTFGGEPGDFVKVDVDGKEVLIAAPEGSHYGTSARGDLVQINADGSKVEMMIGFDGSKVAIIPKGAEGVRVSAGE
ncbi:MAG: hypothetical protein WCW33_06680 [Candidatus Babeliales bacterium]